jgi:hypothetical protein
MNDFSMEHKENDDLEKKIAKLLREQEEKKKLKTGQIMKIKSSMTEKGRLANEVWNPKTNKVHVNTSGVGVKAGFDKNRADARKDIAAMGNEWDLPDEVKKSKRGTS